jgi:hypothetical protein
MDILSMSDDEFAKMNPPSVSTDEDKSATTPVPPVQEDTQANPAPEKNTEPEAEPKTEDPPKSEESAPEVESDPEPESKKDEEPELPAEEPKVEVKTEEPESKPEPVKTEPEAKVNPEYEAFYKKVMTPFKANGKTVQLNSVEEVVQLMQMGANYTKKMQSIQQNKKYLIMLENNGLLDESKLSFLIDLDKKNPEAIKKLMKDAKIDPVDVDPADGVNYQGGAHAVTDQEAALASAIDEVSSSPEGKATLQSIHTTWDASSKKVLFDDPSLLAIIHSQHENGIYAKIVNEMERRKTFGQLAPNAPFLQAYKMVGDDMNAKGAFGVTKPAAAPSKPAAGTPVAVRAVKTPAAKAAEAARVRAAAAPRSAAQASRSNVNVLAMSDDDFLKQYGSKF